MDASALRAAYEARAINVEQIMRVNGKQLEGITSISAAADTLEQVSTTRGQECICESASAVASSTHPPPPPPPDNIMTLH